MTFSNRRRLIRLLFLFCESAFIPFVMGIVLSLFFWTRALTNTFETLDKTGFSVCVTTPKEQGGNHG
ncbi:MAG: hypothetical protein QX197_09385 [Methylococcaceae bacterium]